MDALFAPVAKNDVDSHKDISRWAISEAVAVWIEETRRFSSLVPLKDAMQLHFTAEGQRSMEVILSVLKQDTAWQLALGNCMSIEWDTRAEAARQLCKEAGPACAGPAFLMVNSNIPCRMTNPSVKT